MAVPDPRLQEKACACIVLEAGATDYTLEGVQQFLAEKGVAKQYWPERLEIMDQFPVTPSGKIRKVNLRQQFAAEAR